MKDRDIIRDSDINLAKPVYTRICDKCRITFETNHKNVPYCEACDPCTYLDPVYDD